MPIGAACLVAAGVVLSLFVDNVVPTSYLWRPLFAAMSAAVVVGAIASGAGRYGAGFSAAVVLLAMWPGLGSLLVVLLIAIAVVVSRIVDKTLDLGWVVLSASGVFALAGIIQALPLLAPQAAPVIPEEGGEPTYLILLDGYSRADVLAELDIDISDFLGQMEQRGFDYYSEAESLHYTTHRTLTAMLVGRVDPPTRGSLEERRMIRDEWRLPDGFVTVAPGWGHVTIPHAADVGPGGINDFEIRIVQQSAFGWLAGDLMVAAWTRRAAESIDVIAEHPRVFAHIVTPHAPYVYGPHGMLGAPECWPECDLFGRRPRNDPNLASTIEWLNQLLIELVDEIVIRHPNAQIVLFGDHGMRFADEPPDDAYKPLLLARTSEPWIFADAPRPDQILRILD